MVVSEDVEGDEDEGLREERRFCEAEEHVGPVQEMCESRMTRGH